MAPCAVASDVASLLAQMRNSPAGVRFADACKVVTHFFGAPRQSGTSHRVWKMPWPGDPRVNMQEGDGGKAKAYQVRQALAAIDALLAQQAAISSQPPEPGPAAARRPARQKRR